MNQYLSKRSLFLTKTIRHTNFSSINFKPIKKYSPSYACASISSGSDVKGGYFEKILPKKWLSPLNAKDLQRKGSSLCLKCTLNLDVVDFMEKCQLPDTFNSWFVVVELHVWMLGVRVMQRNVEASAIVRNGIVEALWKEAHQRIGDLGVRGGERNRSVWNYSDEFRVSTMMYDYGLITDDINLANAIWERIFGKVPDADIIKIEELVSYVRRTLLMLEKLEDDVILSQKFTWLEFPNK